MRKQAEQRLKDLGISYGLRCVEERFSDIVQAYAPNDYKGPTIYYCGSTCEERISNLAHDLAHFILAPKVRRLEPDFGLGPSPDSLKSAKRLIKPKRAYAEERRASVYGMILEQFVGVVPDYTFSAHGWGDGDDPNAVLGTLHKAGLLLGAPGSRSLVAPGYRFDPAAALRRVTGTFRRQA